MNLKTVVNEASKENKELENDLLIQIKIAKWHRKWIKLQKQLRQWQGMWRDRKMLDDPEKNKELPLKLSKHLFKNGSRCLMKLRTKNTEYISLGNYLNIKETKEPFNTISTICELHKFPKYKFTARNLTRQERVKDIAKAINNRSSKNSIDCEIYSCLCVKKGQILITYSEVKDKYYIKFVLSKKRLMEDDLRVMFNFCYKKGMKLVKKWSVEEIRIIYKKVIVERHSGLEIVFSLGKSVLFNFVKESDCDLFCFQLMKLARNATKIDCSPHLGRQLEKGLTEDWVRWKISTFDYLMALNNLSCRSVDNFSQYPVFPWILNNVTNSTLDLNDPNSYRNLELNLALLGEESKAKLLKRSEEFHDMNEHAQFYLGSHYSNQGVIFQYLMRVYPFFEAYVKLFSGLDDPNRMFHSIKESLMSIKQEPSDIRELIPEFFTVPEIYMNLNKIHFGRRDFRVEVNDVILPPWADKSAVKFIRGLMEMLESDYTSYNINKWVDLIFGYKQQGEEAEKAFNLFPQLSYRPEETLANTSEEQKKAFKMQAYHWGQTPIQRFTKKHPVRLRKDPSSIYSILDHNARPKAYGISSPLCKPTNQNKVIKIFTSETKDKRLTFTLITIKGSILEYAVEFSESKDKPTSLFIVNSSIKEYNNNYFDNDIILLDDIEMNEFPLIMIKKSNPPHLAQGGYKNGCIQLTQLTSLNEVKSFSAHNDTVIALGIDKDEKIAVSGSVLGEIVIYEVKDKMQWRAKKRIWDSNTLSCINLSNELLLFCTGSCEGIVNMYTYSGNIVRTFCNPSKQAVEYVILCLIR